MKHTDGQLQLTIDKGQLTVVERVLQMERVCFDEPWLSVNPNSVFVIEDYGYAVGTQNELHRIAVLPEFRGKGLSYSLMRSFLDKCNGEVFLEVASKNAHAVKLYKKCGFKEIARRKDYYKDDDCIVMSMNTASNSSNSSNSST
ncbi:MAG: GNAT family N-acetyltransferase [Oscillospiraceae bacterium]|nr:GNAT family N-acetyltransferase [Oscillospiraceae bacterium]